MKLLKQVHFKPSLIGQKSTGLNSGLDLENQLAKELSHAENNTELTGSRAQRKELEELMLTLDLMEAECVQRQLDNEKEAMKDEFKALKREMYKDLQECNELIRARYASQMRSGNSVEVIEKGVRITKKLDELDKDFEVMSDILKKQVKQRGKKFQQEDLDRRFDEMQALKQQIEEAKKMFKNNRSQPDLATPHKTLLEIQSQAAVPSAANAQGQQEWAEMTEEERAVVERWKARDAGFDKQVLEIGDVVDHLRECALNIEEETKKQTQYLESLNKRADETGARLTNANGKIREILKQQNTTSWVCKLVLSLILVGLLGYIVSILNKRLIK